MNQTRVFLILAWLMVAMLLWMEWGKEQAAPPAAAAPAAAAIDAEVADAVPAPVAAAPSADAAVPAPSAAAPAPVASAQAAQGAARVSVTTDVLKLVLDGGSVLQADLLQYPQDKDGSTPVRLFSIDPAHFYNAQSGWVSAGGQAPSHQSGFVPAGAERQFTLAEGQDELVVPFVWQGADGVQIRRSYVFKRGAYAVEVRDEVSNQGASTWQGQAYRQLVRKPQVIKRGYTSPESFSFNGAAWFDGSYDRRAFDEDYLEDGKLNLQASNGWVAMLQHHFFSAWLPAGQAQPTTISLDEVGGRALVRELAAPVAVAPGASVTSQARLYVGPKLVDQIRAQGVPGLERAVDYSQFSILALLGEALFWVLSKIHGLVGNWGWAIIGLVIVVKLLMYPLSAAQYKSFAKMRKFQPRIQQLKERYGDDRQKFQMAMMELYKKEKINPMGGCLPILVQMPVFLALYWVLVESVELRHAPWVGWIQDLTARDPWFILPVVNVAVMWFTQKLQPAPGVDPVQQKMMMIMPLVFGVMMAFFPAGLVLYWVTNGALGLLQQWWMMKRHGEPAPAAAK